MTWTVGSACPSCLAGVWPWLCAAPLSPSSQLSSPPGLVHYTHFASVSTFLDSHLITASACPPSTLPALPPPPTHFPGLWWPETPLSFTICCGPRASLLCSMWDLPGPGIEPPSADWQADSLPLSHQGSPLRSHWYVKMPLRLKPRVRLLWTGHLFLQARCLSVSKAEPERLPHHPAAGQGRGLEQCHRREIEHGSHGWEPHVQFQVFQQPH